MTSNPTFIAMPALSERIDRSKSSIYRWVLEGRFPKPIRIGPRASAWRITDIEAWETDPLGWIHHIAD